MEYLECRPCPPHCYDQIDNSVEGKYSAFLNFIFLIFWRRILFIEITKNSIYHVFLVPQLPPRPNTGSIWKMANFEKWFVKTIYFWLNLLSLTGTANFHPFKKEEIDDSNAKGLVFLIKKDNFVCLFMSWWWVISRIHVQIRKKRN